MFLTIRVTALCTEPQQNTAGMTDIRSNVGTGGEGEGEGVHVCVFVFLHAGVEGWVNEFSGVWLVEGGAQVEWMVGAVMADVCPGRGHLVRGQDQEGLEGVVEELVSGRALGCCSGVLSACLWAVAVAEYLHLVEPHWQLKSLPLMSQKWSP